MYNINSTVLLAKKAVEVINFFFKPPEADKVPVSIVRRFHCTSKYKYIVFLFLLKISLHVYIDCL